MKCKVEMLVSCARL
uniref:Uncharacterized protein n=1 Tax=Arundo donax TaxID=35708 RepID=A0A0A8Z607_ARUDO